MTQHTSGPRQSRRFRIRWRPWLRAIHRDVGYFSVGLTFIYALSGLAVNHIASDGECNWMEGVQLLAVYLILGLAFYFLPATP